MLKTEEWQCENEMGDDELPKNTQFKITHRSLPDVRVRMNAAWLK